MKLSELKTRLKNKYVVRIVAGVLTIALLGSSMTAVAVQADQKKRCCSSDRAGKRILPIRRMILRICFRYLSVIKKSEKMKMFTLFPMQREVYDTIVTDHLINKNQSATLEDQSNLTDIKREARSSHRTERS